MSDDQLFREINEELRHEEMRKLWDKYGVFILAGALAIVLAVAGYKGWQYWQAKRAQESGARFHQAVKLIEGGKEKEAQTILNELAEGGSSGYAGLARLRLAAAKLGAGDNAAAIAAYDAVTEDGGVDRMFRDFARIQAAMLRLDSDAAKDLKTRIGDMAKPGQPFRHMAREILGLAAFKDADYAAAETYMNESLSDPAVPQGIRQRAEMMLSLIAEATAGDGKKGETAGMAGGKKNSGEANDAASKDTLKTKGK